MKTDTVTHRQHKVCIHMIVGTSSIHIDSGKAHGRKHTFSWKAHVDKCSVLNEISHLRRVTYVSALERASSAAPSHRQVPELTSARVASRVTHVADTAALAQVEHVGRIGLLVESSA